MDIYLYILWSSLMDYGSKTKIREFFKLYFYFCLEKMPYCSAVQLKKNPTKNKN